MADLAYLLIIIVAFAALAVLTGWLDRALVARPVPGARPMLDDPTHAEVRR